MRGFIYLVLGAGVIALAFWTYRKNYATQESLRMVKELRKEIGAARTSLAVNQAEWAYLNRPERLRELSKMNFGSLQLMPFAPEQFGETDQVAYPAPELGPITNAVEVRGRMGEETE